MDINKNTKCNVHTDMPTHKGRYKINRKQIMSHKSIFKVFLSRHLWVFNGIVTSSSAEKSHGLFQSLTLSVHPLASLRVNTHTHTLTQTHTLTHKQSLTHAYTDPNLG